MVPKLASKTPFFHFSFRSPKRKRAKRNKSWGLKRTGTGLSTGLEIPGRGVRVRIWAPKQKGHGTARQVEVDSPSVHSQPSTFRFSKNRIHLTKEGFFLVALGERVGSLERMGKLALEHLAHHADSFSLVRAPHWRSANFKSGGPFKAPRSTSQV